MKFKTEEAKFLPSLVKEGNLGNSFQLSFIQICYNSEDAFAFYV
jgi:hypothetical protein